MEGEGGRKRKPFPNDYGFLDILFSWSLENIFDENFLKSKVEKIPESFESVAQYFKSYAYPLLEETRAQLCSSLERVSQAPFAEVVDIRESKPYGKHLYDTHVDYWMNRFSNDGKEPYKTLPGDVLILADTKPEYVFDPQRQGKNWIFVSVTKIADDVTKIADDEKENDTISTYFKVKAVKDIEMCFNDMKKSMFVIFLTNITPNRRIWNSLHMKGNLSIIKEGLCGRPMDDEKCELCLMQNQHIWHKGSFHTLSSVLNESQVKTSDACLRRTYCKHKSGFELVWGPPGTGKTKTVSLLLFELLRMKYRTIICAPTNAAIKEVASRVLKLVMESFENHDENNSPFCPLGDILLFGTNERLKVGKEIEDIYLDYRIRRLSECFGVLTGWRSSFTSVIDFFEDCVSHYHIFLQNELVKENEDGKGESKPFLLFVRERFTNLVTSLKRCISVFCTHIPVSEKIFQDLVAIMGSMDSFETLLFKDDIVSEELEDLFLYSASAEAFTRSVNTNYLLQRRYECQTGLKNLLGSLNSLDLPSASIYSLRDFCCENASLIFCTASSSYKLHSVAMKPLNFVIIDEAAQLKESEAAIPLQLPGIKQAILVGDEFQLSAMVVSNTSAKAGFGRSLFERLSSLGHSKHLLNVQYRMHPKISFFPNSYFYDNQILNGLNVHRKNYEKQYLPGPMFGPYSFINVSDGNEEFDENGHSCRNMVEVSVVTIILRKLYKAWISSKQSLSVGVITPYAAQVVAIKEKLGSKYDNIDGFVVKVKSVDGFQGGEEDVVIIPTVRSNHDGSIGFIANPQRANVALTRARHCLWILGNERTLTRSGSVWKDILYNAKHRQCFFNAGDDKDLAKAILDVKKEFDELDQLLNPESIVFRSQRWKVVFSESFLKSFKRLRSVQTRKSVMNLLLKLASGWRPKRKKVDSICERSFQLVKQFKVEGLYVICTIDIVKECQYMQVLKIWDVLSLEDVPKLVKRLDNISVRYTDDYIKCCKEKSLEGNLEVPKMWAVTSNIVKHKSLATSEDGNDISDAEGGSYAENSKVSESLLLMKFYSLSSSVVRHLLSDRDGRELELPFEVTDEELEIILFPRSTFILGRSGTGKTTILTMKLFQKEKLHQLAVEGIYGGQASSSKYQNVSSEMEYKQEMEREKKLILRQLFVTVSPKLCFAVKQHVSQLKRSAFGGNLPAESSLTDIDDIGDVEQFKNIQNSLIDIPLDYFPLVITFHKFLMMLDGTVGISYFERFRDLRKYSDGQIQRSVALEAFIRNNEVNYDRFSSFYWPHFDLQLTAKLDSSRVFTEIISHIKGCIRALNFGEGKLTREDYVQLSESRVSTLSKSKRDRIYGIFESYERMKAKRGAFDLADLVIDLHHRLGKENYGGDMMDFVYIDEVQDLTMSQLGLFKYICKNVEEGFVFSGDTAQTIAKGIDFRFQDIKSLFYNSFLLGSKKEKGQISEIFNLSQNFRTHAGILKLSQSVIDLLYRFFPQSVDILEPETSLIYGEPPVLLESSNNEDAIIKIFGGNGKASGTMVGFGAEQVILVRDEIARKEIINHVGKQALVLTIFECKGLEFQDVLLCNFFSKSPLRNQWRVIYSYMKEQYSSDNNIPKCPSFNEARHGILCAELKQLYVAITRTRQRLWIWENNQELSEPMFDYWKKMSLVQVKQLDDSLAHDMQVESTTEEWRSRGIKLFQEQHYEIATMCFERAGDRYWERRSKASHLKATADRIRDCSPQEAKNILREAAEIFEAIGRAPSAAKCFYDLGEFERAGRIYLERCEDSELVNAAECFNLAGCYELAADVYARGCFFTECLGVCSKAKLFDMGLQYIHDWKLHANKDVGSVRRSKEIEGMEREFLETCARHYHKLKDTKSMMKFVKAFHSLDLMRNFLRSLDCYDELLVLEEEWGNFIEAANIAKQRGNLLLAADLEEKARNFKEASELVLDYVFFESLWGHGSKGWPLKQFKQKEELLKKARFLAKQYGDEFYQFVCLETNVLSDQQRNLSMIAQHFNNSKRLLRVRSEILSARKILDFHLHSNTSKFGWEDYLVLDPMTYSRGKFFKNEISVETLVCFWKYWKDTILKVLESLEHLETLDISKLRIYGDFCLSFFGVLKQNNNNDTQYFLLNSDVEWARQSDHRFCPRSGKLLSIDIRPLVSCAQSYWGGELLTVGIKVLDTLEAFHKQSIYRSESIFCGFRCLVHIYEVAKSLLDSKFLYHHYNDTRKLQRFMELSAEHVFDYAFHQEWQESLKSNMISLRRTEVCRKMFSDIVGTMGRKNKLLSYWQIGRVLVMILGSSCLSGELYQNVAQRISVGSPWKTFLEVLFCNNNNDNNLSRELLVMNKFREALEDTYGANWRKTDYISPACVLYLIERLMILLCYFKGFILTTKSSFVEWLLCEELKPINTHFTSVDARESIGDILVFLVHVVGQLLSNFRDTAEWTKKYPNEIDSSVVILRLVILACLLHLNIGMGLNLLSDVLHNGYITSQLPREFYDILRRGRKRKLLEVDVNMIAAAFEKIGNPLMVVSLGVNCSKFMCPNTIFVDMNVSKRKEDILGILFPKATTSDSHNGIDQSEAIDLFEEETDAQLENQVESSYISSPSPGLQQDEDVSTQNIEKVDLAMNSGRLRKVFESLESIEDVNGFTLEASTMKVEVEECINIIEEFINVSTDAKGGCCFIGVEVNKVDEATKVLKGLKQLQAAVDEIVSATILEDAISANIGGLRKNVLSVKQSLEHFLGHIESQQHARKSSEDIND